MIGGRTFTASELQAAHAAHEARFAAASRLGAMANINVGTSAGPVGPPTHVVPPQDSLFRTYAGDDQAFCTAAKTTACSYLPTNTALYVNFPGDGDFERAIQKIVQGFKGFSEVDLLVTDSNICTQESGSFVTVAPHACVYAARGRLQLQFRHDHRSPRRDHRDRQPAAQRDGKRLLGNAVVGYDVYDYRDRADDDQTEIIARPSRRRARLADLFLGEYVAQFFERLLLQTGDVHLGHVETLGDLRLRDAFVEA